MFREIWNIITGKIDDSAGVLDHIPLNRYQPEAKPVKPKFAGTTPEQAKAKHGKTFKAHSLVARETPPSRDLIEMDQLSAKEAARHTVTKIKKDQR